MKRIYEFLSHDLVRIIGGFALFAAALVLEYYSLEIAAYVLFALTLVFAGFPVFADAILGILRGDMFDEKLLMSLGAIGAMIIGEGSEGCAVMLFYLVGEYFEGRAVRRSRASIKALMDICPDESTVIREGVESVVFAEEVAVGDTLVIRPGERVAVDCKITGGEAHLNTAHLTGESIPRSVGVGELIESGSVVLDGVLFAEALRVAEDSAASRILSLVETAADNKSREEYFITKFARFYTPSVVVLALLIVIVPAVFSWLTLTESVYRALTFLVFSCPCALVISVPMAFFGGIGRAASRGILYKGGNVMSPLSRAKTFAFDKTGTLTEGKLGISDIQGFGMGERELLPLAASAEYGSNHPIAECIKAAAGSCVPAENIREISGKGIAAEYEKKRLLVGNAALMADFGIKADGYTAAKTHVYVALSDTLVGVISLSDSVRPEAKSAISSLKSLGVERTVMLTGDVSRAANAVASELGISDVRAELLPKDKYDAVSELIKSGGCVFVGDGINDAPSITLADVGIAMGASGSDSAIESADVVIMSDNLERLPEAIKIARKTLLIAKENIIFALGIKATVLILGALGYVNMWLAVFADVGVAILAILNAMRALVGERGAVTFGKTEKVPKQVKN